MKILLKIIGIIIFLIVGYVVIALLAFRKNYHFEKSVVIEAPCEKVWEHIASTKEMNVWNPFAKADPNIQITYSGIQGTVGDAYHWKGNDEVGEGEETITEVIPNKKLSCNLHFIKPWEGVAKTKFILTPEEKGTRVTWAIDNELTTGMKLLKPMMDMQMGKMFGQGLDELKVISEK
ncbi:SRPBCC family protein [Chryseobacterium sp. MYb264]|uniref:SRPBCC family protein n=1 Tax=Chryseobacterium sp. MYb264 TaxID=2745153 RepID=UPI002E1077AF|nr:SRPBCC family protein [Chryseobacterium sp. MYb264]